MGTQLILPLRAAVVDLKRRASVSAQGRIRTSAPGALDDGDSPQGGAVRRFAQPGHYLKPADVERIASLSVHDTAHTADARSARIHHPSAAWPALRFWKLDVQALMAALLHDV